MRARSASTLAMPSVLPSACTWRLTFDSDTWSRSISVSARDAAARQRLRGPRADAADTDDGDVRGANARIGAVAIQAAQAAEAALEVGVVARDRDGRGAGRRRRHLSDASRSRPACAASERG